MILVGVVAAGLNLAGAAHASAAPCRPSWGVQPANGGPGPNQLDAVAVVSDCDAWAVGSYSKINSRTQHPLIEQWNGKAWKVRRSPNPGGSSGTELYGVAATSSSNAWVVGYYWNGNADQTVIERWNGTAWKVQPSPNPGGPTNNNGLSSVAATSSTDAWAVGSYSNGTTTQTLVEHWNGKKWKVQPSPSPGGSLCGINRAPVGIGGGVGLFSVAATSSTDAWAVGARCGHSAIQTLIEHWNGNKWKVQQGKNPGGSSERNSLSGVTATSSNDAWAVGAYIPNSMTPQKTLIEHWNGRAWKVQASPSPGGSSSTELNGVAATSSSNAWAVGDYGNYVALDPPVVERWNGKRWRLQPSLNFGGASSLLGVAAASPTDAWAVGYYYDGTADRTLALHCC